MSEPFLASVFYLLLSEIVTKKDGVKSNVSSLLCSYQISEPSTSIIYPVHIFLSRCGRLWAKRIFLTFPHFLPHSGRMACFSKMWLISNFHKVKIIALAAFLYLVSPLILLCILLLLSYRVIISICSKVSRKDLVGIVCPSTSVYASDELYGIPNRNFVCSLVLKGRLSLESLQSAIDRKILSVKNAKGHFKYPHLRTYPVKFQKFLFWKLEEEFKVDSHVFMYDKAKDNNRIWTELDLQEIQKNLIRKQWARFASPWEILLIPNYRTQSCGAREKTVLCVRFHMCLENEVSWMKILVQLLCDGNSGSSSGSSSPDVSVSSLMEAPPTLPPLPISGEGQHNVVDILGNSKNISSAQVPFRGTRRKLHFICGRILKKLLLPFRIPLDFAEQMLEPLSSSEWHVAETSLLKRDHVVMLDRFSVQHVKEIKNMLGVTFSSVLMAALSSALRVTFMEAGLKLPSQMKVMLPFPHGNNNSSTADSKDGDGYVEINQFAKIFVHFFHEFNLSF